MTGRARRDPPGRCTRSPASWRHGSIGIVGVSSGINPGRVILRNILHEGFDPERITVVKPGIDRIDGVRCVPDLASLPEKVDLFVIVLPAAATPAFVAELVERDLAESMIVIPGGLEEKSGGDELATRMRDALAVPARTRTAGPSSTAATASGSARGRDATTRCSSPAGSCRPGPGLHRSP